MEQVQLVEKPRRSKPLRRLLFAVVAAAAGLLALVLAPGPVVVGPYALVGPSCRSGPAEAPMPGALRVVSRLELTESTSLLLGEDGTLLTARRLPVGRSAAAAPGHPRLLWHGHGFYLVRHR